jgi:hypothetical protein
MLFSFFVVYLMTLQNQILWRQTNQQKITTTTRTYRTLLDRQTENAQQTHYSLISVLSILFTVTGHSRAGTQHTSRGH